MALITIDATSWISAWRRDTKLFQWVTLVTTLAFSGVVSFLGSCGSAMAGHRPTLEAIGIGMIHQKHHYCVARGRSESRTQRKRPGDFQVTYIVAIAGLAIVCFLVALVRFFSNPENYK